jgi:hypothetical protein
MAEQLTEKANSLRDELIELERQFNIKKEEFFKVQGSYRSKSSSWLRIETPQSYYKKIKGLCQS